MLSFPKFSFPKKKEKYIFCGILPAIGLLRLRAGSHFDISISISRHTQTQYEVDN